ncbi:tocopherol cyclase family protein [Haloplasma contractile]|uniref:Tocopherol cyclase protein n=1 Tax=Haloplasma contractile SSD-17B TaxID=1033810 RepID=U2ECK8_9MOLU|nr:tocopherol cyclase family protein [Haloplasma contractile]ERJ12496.1 Tocopherol cyclase protein [Haloplasma contractile SSD-17B]
MFKEIRNPDLYHGRRKKNNYFEGWYFKIVDVNNEHSYAFIPGISKGKELDDSHSFIQVLDGNNVTTEYIKFDQKDFHSEKKTFEIGILNNKFSLSKLSLAIEGETKLSGTLRFKNILKWPDSILNPGSMGYYNYFTFMECYSQVCALNGDIEGILTINNKEIDFTNGKVYIEKNWGKSFPQSWIWIQSNSFNDRNVSLTCSIGRVPFLFGKTFSGFLVALSVNNQVYKFTTMNKSKMTINRSGNDVRIDFKRKNLLLKIKTKSKLNQFIQVKGPKNGEMVSVVDETLKGEVVLKLIDLTTHEIIYSGVGKRAGIEYGGELRIL